MNHIKHRAEKMSRFFPKKNTVLLLVLVLAGFIMRIWDLQNTPAGFFADEASIGYNAYAIGHTAHDEHGVFLPFFFRAFGEYKNPVQTYATVPFILIFGLQEWSVRIVSAIFGTASILGIYLLTKQLFKKLHDHENPALLAAFFLTITPWSIHLSRVALEGIMSFVFFTELAVYFFLRIEERFQKSLLLSIFFFSLAFYSYFPARIFLPFLFLFLVALFHKTVFKKHHTKSLLLALVLIFFCSLPMLNSLKNQTLLNRWQQVSIFANHDTKVNPFSHVITNYISHFTPDFLFLRGDIDMEGQAITRHSVRGFGQLFLFQLPLVIAGVLFLIKKDRRTLFMFLTWLTLYPLGSMFTTDATAQATRSIIGIIPLTVFSGIGMWYIIKYIHHFGGLVGKMTTVVFFAIIISSSILYLKTYFLQYNFYSSDFWGWQYGPREVMKYFLANKNNYDDLYMSGEFNGGHIFLRFYDPENICGGKCKIGDFTRETDIYHQEKKQLFSLSPEYILESPLHDRFKTLKTIYYPDKKVAFKIGVIVQ